MKNIPWFRLLLSLVLSIHSLAPARADESAQVEQQYVDRVNGERSVRNLSQLRINPLLVETARGHSLEMSDLGYFDHFSPTSGLESPADRFLKTVKDHHQSPPNGGLIGENIFYCAVFNDVYGVDYGHAALMNSPTHRANILEPRFEEIGVGIHRSQSGEIWVTEMFKK